MEKKKHCTILDFNILGKPIQQLNSGTSLHEFWHLNCALEEMEFPQQYLQKQVKSGLISKKYLKSNK